MLNSLRTGIGKWLIGLGVALIVVVFVVSGVMTRSSTQGIHEAAVAGSVNGSPITLREFNGALERRSEMLKAFTGGKLTEDQMKMFRVKESVFRELVQAKLAEQQAESLGVVVDAVSIRTRIEEMPVFQKEGKFDQAAYREVLARNGFTPGKFEDLIRKDLMVQKFGDFVKGRAKVSPQEVEQEALRDGEKRDLRFVAISTASVRPLVSIPDAEVKAYVADKANDASLKAQFEAKKETEFKGKTFDQVAPQLAKIALADKKPEAIKALQEEWGKKVVALYEKKSKDDVVNAALKPIGLTVKSTGLVSQGRGFLPGVGEANSLFSEAFAKKAPGLLTPGLVAGSWVTAEVKAVQVADLAKVSDQDRKKFEEQLSGKKERELYEAWIKASSKKASIQVNEDVVGKVNPADLISGS